MFGTLRLQHLKFAILMSCIFHLLFSLLSVIVSSPANSTLPQQFSLQFATAPATSVFCGGIGIGVARYTAV